MKEYVLSFEEKTAQPWVTYFQFAGTNPFNLIFWRFQYMITRI